MYERIANTDLDFSKMGSIEQIGKAEQSALCAMLRGVKSWSMTTEEGRPRGRWSGMVPGCVYSDLMREVWATDNHGFEISVRRDEDDFYFVRVTAMMSRQSYTESEKWAALRELWRCDQIAGIRDLIADRSA